MGEAKSGRKDSGHTCIVTCMCFRTWRARYAPQAALRREEQPGMHHTRWFWSPPLTPAPARRSRIVHSSILNIFRLCKPRSPSSAGDSSNAEILVRSPARFACHATSEVYAGLLSGVHALRRDPLRVQHAINMADLHSSLASPPFALVRARDVCVYTWTPFRPGGGRPDHVRARPPHRGLDQSRIAAPTSRRTRSRAMSRGAPGPRRAPPPRP